QMDLRKPLWKPISRLFEHRSRVLKSALVHVELTGVVPRHRPRRYLYRLQVSLLRQIDLRSLNVEQREIQVDRAKTAPRRRPRLDLGRAAFKIVDGLAEPPSLVRVKAEVQIDARCAVRIQIKRRECFSLCIARATSFKVTARQRCVRLDRVGFDRNT